MIGTVVGGTVLVLFLASVPARVAPIENAQTTTSVDAACNRIMKGGTYFIEVAGARYECTGSDSWCPYRVPTPVVYDSDKPSQCRPASAAGRLSRWERAALLHYAAQAAAGISFLLIREHDTSRLRWLISHGLLLFWAGSIAFIILCDYSAMK